MIHITDSQTDKILGFIPEDEFWDDVHKKSIKDTLETFDFTTFADREYAEHLAKRNRIIIPDEDGKYVEFVIENTRKYRDSSGGLFVEVYTSATYIELAKAKVIKPQTLSSQTVSTAVSHAIGGTEWEAGNIADVGTKTFVIEEHTNPYSYLKRIASEFDLELHFRVEVAGNKVVRRYVDLVERVGMWRGREVEFGKDLIGIERKEDFSNIVTALIGLGPEREDGTRLEVFVEDKDALARWGRNGQHIIEVYEPQSTDQTMTEARLRELTQNELEKRINSTVEYTADIADLEKVPGLEHEKIRFGDTIRIKDTSFTPPLYLEARIHTVERSIKKNGYKTVTLGDYIEYTEEEVMAIWKSLQAEIVKKVSMDDVTEVVYTKPEVDDKDASVYQDSTYYADGVAETKKQEAIQVAATDATNKANQAETNAKSHADTVAMNAENSAKSHADSIAEQKKQEAINAAIADAETKINTAKTELEADIALKADAEWVNGQLQLKENAIHRGATAPTDTTKLWLDTSVVPNVLKRYDSATSSWVKATPTSAGEVGAYTKTEVDNALNSKVSVTQYTTDMNGVVVRLDSAESRITQTEQEIATKVSNTTYQQDKAALENDISALETRMSNAETSITQNANQIALKANATDVYTKSQVDGQFSTVNQQISDLSAELSVQADQIATKVSQTEFENSIAGFEGRNYIRNGNFSKDLSNWSDWGVANKEIVEINGKKYVHIWQNDTNLHRGISQNNIPLERGIEYTISFEAFGSTDINNNNNGIRLIIHQLGDGSNSPQISNTFIVNDEPKKFKYTFTSSETDDYFRVMIGGISDMPFDVYITEIKLEKGTRATPWTPAPEDTQSQIDGLGTRVSSAETSITQLSNQIQLKANQSTVDTLANRISSTESTINLLSDEIDLKVNKDGVISSINQTAEQIKIQASKVDLSGYVTFTNLSTPGQTTIDGGNLKTGSITADKLNVTSLSAISADLGTITAGSLTGNSISIANDKVLINSSGITVTDGDFLLKDVANNIYSILAKTNYVNDHSFETVPTTGLPDLNYNWFEMATVTDYVPVWYKVGNPKVAMIANPVPFNAFPIFGSKAIVVNSSNYVQQEIAQLAPGVTYTVSAYFKRQWNTTAGAPKITISRYSALGTITGTIKTATFPTVPNDYKVVRYATTFTVPSDLFDNKETVLISISSTNSNWVQCDGVQAVEGSVPVLYQLENNLWDYISGRRVAEWIRTRDLLVERRLEISVPAKHIVLNESDAAKNWHIEVNNNDFHIVETDVATRLTLTTGGGLLINWMNATGDITFSNYTGRLVNDSGNGYLQTTGSEYRVTKYKSTTYIPIRAASFPSGSLEEYKTNIEKWEGSALEIIRSADIYKYQLKSDIADGRHIERYGLVIGEGYRTPKELVDGDGIEQYAMNSVNMKAIQELDKEQQDLKGRIARLEAENELLREKIKKLEGMIA